MIFFKSYLLVMLITLSTWFIAHDKYFLSLVTSFCISLTWAFNVNSMSNSNLKDKIIYSCGAVSGTGTALLISRLL